MSRKSISSTPHDPNTGEVIPYEEDSARVDVIQSGAVALNKSEWEAQLDAAHKYKRSVSVFIKELTNMATINVEVAESCIYALPRGGKTISGPSVRFAEMAASAWGNMHIGARVVGIEEREIVAQGVAIDLEKNVRYSVESRRRITKKDGARFDDDMITVTGNAAASIALRNAIFRVVPRAYVSMVYNEVQKVATGDSKTLATKRAHVLGRLALLGADEARVLSALGKKGVDDIGLEDVKNLIGLGTSIKEGAVNIDDAFPAVAPPTTGAPEGTRMPLGKPKAEAKPEAAPAAKADDVPISAPEAPKAEPAKPAKAGKPTPADKRGAIEAEFKRLAMGPAEQRAFLEDQGVTNVAALADDSLDEVLRALVAIAPAAEPGSDG